MFEPHGPVHYGGYHRILRKDGNPLSSQRAGAPEQVCVLTFYKEPSRRLEDFAQRHRIELATVDLIQGREVDVVIVLTTRTSVREESAEFIDDHLRINVALTRWNARIAVRSQLANINKLSGSRGDAVVAPGADCSSRGVWHG
ncbi:unnamed protein product [Heligmosomoides polygyrus]|uniref:AAA_12 domain-containing protein n=1 Tax=Heligmosomoides polygyrus TaxID=6339 RepID=A0A183GF66_HELPZ|nr:unnamed protein product [Heligmosomoides polygyrus]